MQKRYECAVIFAGGKSSRMGTDKALLPFGGYKSMSEFLYTKLSPSFNNIYISSKNNKFDFHANIITDKYPQSSPMVALVSIFETILCDEIFVLSVDSPLVSIETVNKLYEKLQESKDVDAIIAVSPDGIEPMCGIYRRNIYQKAKEYLLSDIHQLVKLLDNSNVEHLLIDSQNEFLNLNRAEDYDKAVAIFASLPR